MRACWGLLVALLLMAATDGAFAQSPDDWRSRSIVDETRLGLFGHNIEPSGTEQGGLDVNAEILFAKPVAAQDRGSLHSFLMPRIHIGAQINVDGDTSQLYAGFTWDLRLHERFSFEVTFGGVVHDGPTNGEESAFGCVANFRESGSIGVGLTGACGSTRRWRTCRTPASATATAASPAAACASATCSTKRRLASRRSAAPSFSQWSCHGWEQLDGQFPERVPYANDRRVLDFCNSPNSIITRTWPLAFSITMHANVRTEPIAPPTPETSLDQGPRRTPFRPFRSNSGSRPHGPRPANQRRLAPPSGHVRHGAGNARTNYERYTTMAKDAARRGDVIEAENYYQHAEHYFRVMRGRGLRPFSLRPLAA